MKLARVLEYLHGFQPPILHRDLKPANVLVTAAERVLSRIDLASGRVEVLRRSANGIDLLVRLDRASRQATALREKARRPRALPALARKRRAAAPASLGKG